MKQWDQVFANQVLLEEKARLSYTQSSSIQVKKPHDVAPDWPQRRVQSPPPATAWNMRPAECEMEFIASSLNIKAESNFPGFVNQHSNTSRHV